MSAKKYLAALLVLSASLLSAGTVRIFFTPQTFNIDGGTTRVIKVYYGPEQGFYTNSVVCDLNPIKISTNSWTAYDAFACQYYTFTDKIIIPISNLEVGQDFFWGYSAVSSNGTETRINDSICPYVVTNELNRVSGPTNLQVQIP